MATPAVIAAQHIWLVEVTARRLHRKMRTFDVEEMIADGMVGLVQAANRYTPGPVPFQAYARQRVKGSIIEAHKARYGWNESTHSYRERPLSFDAGIDDLTPFEDHDGPSAEDAYINSVEAAELVIKGLELLPPHLRAVAEALVAGLTLTELALQLGVPISTARNWRRALARWTHLDAEDPEGTFSFRPPQTGKYAPPKPQRRPDHCSKGHQFDYVSKRGKRGCRRCATDRAQKATAKDLLKRQTARREVLNLLDA